MVSLCHTSRYRKKIDPYSYTLEEDLFFKLHSSLESVLIKSTITVSATYVSINNTKTFALNHLPEENKLVLFKSKRLPHMYNSLFVRFSHHYVCCHGIQQLSLVHPFKSKRMVVHIQMWMSFTLLSTKMLCVSELDICGSIFLCGILN